MCRLLFRTIHDVALMIEREQAGRKTSSTAGVLDSQTVKAPFVEPRGYDGAKKIVGRKPHVAVDTDGRLLMANLATVDVSDSAGSQLILDGIRKRWPWLHHLFAGAAYDRTRLMDMAAFLDLIVEIVRPSHKPAGFALPPSLQGLVAPDAAGLAASIVRLHRDPVLFAACREAGLAYVSEAFSENVVNAGLRRAAGLASSPV